MDDVTKPFVSPADQTRSYKNRKHGTVVNLSKTGLSTKTTPREHQQLIQEEVKDPKTTSYDLQTSLPLAWISFHDSTIMNRQVRNWALVIWLKSLMTEKNTFEEKLHQDFWENVQCVDETKKWNFLEVLCPVTSGVKLRNHFKIRLYCQVRWQ